MSRALPRSALLALLLSTAVAGQTVWRKAPLLEGRWAHAMAYDSSRQRVVLFGGNVTNWTAGDTWEWDGTAWSLRTTPAAPPGRMYHALTYDPLRARVVLFGGTRLVNGSWVDLNDLWEWDGVAWQQRMTASGPAPRLSSGMFFDASLGKVVLFGGTGFDDTWIWDGSVWKQAQPTAKPPRGSANAVTYDSRSRSATAGTS